MRTFLASSPSASWRRPEPPGVNFSVVPPQVAPQVTGSSKRCSASRAMWIRYGRVPSRKRVMRPASAPALSWAEASSGSDGSVSVPTTTICPSSIVTDGAPVNQPSGSLPANQPAISSRSGVAMITTLPRSRRGETRRGIPESPSRLLLLRGGRCRHDRGLHLAGRGAACQRGLDGRRQAGHLLPLARLVARLELRQHLTAEQLQRLADVLVLVAARLADEDDLVHAGRLVAAQELADLVGRADRAPQRAHPLLHQAGGQRLALARGDPAVEAERGPALLELLPDVRPARHVLPV